MEVESTLVIAILSALSSITIVAEPPEFQFRTFAKPGFISLLMFFGVSFVWLVQKPSCNIRKAIIVIIPSIFLVLSTVIYNFCVIHGNASCNFLMRQNIILFLPVFLKLKKPRNYQLAAIGSGVVAFIILVFSSTQSWVYPILLIISQLLKYAQVYAEHRVIEQNDIEPSFLTSIEGVWGVLLTAVVVLPILYVIPGYDVSSIPGGALENGIDALRMLSNTPKMMLGAALIALTAFLQYLLALSMASERSVIPYAVSDIIGTIGAWAVFEFAFGGMSDDTDYAGLMAAMQAVSLILYTFSAVTVSRAVRFPCLLYSDWEQIGDQQLPLGVEDLPVDDE